MIHSMTAFSRQALCDDTLNLTWELRSVNHRYLEASFRVPEALRHLEPALREIVKKHLHRGKLDATLRYQPVGEKNVQIDINMPLARALVQAQDTIKPLLTGDVAAVNIHDILRWPGICQVVEVSDNNNQAVLVLFELVCQDLVTARATEGEELAKAMQLRLQQMQDILIDIAQKLPEFNQTLKDKLVERFAEITVEVDSTRVEQEILLHLQKSDVTEELDRLGVHMDEFKRQMDSDQAVGRRLDFLVQEMNREANTLGAKAQNSFLSHASVNLKVFIEQIREQVQNVE